MERFFEEHETEDLLRMEKFATKISCFIEANCDLDSNPIHNIGAYIAIEEILRGLPKGNVDLMGKKSISRHEFLEKLRLEATLLWSKIPTNQLEKFTEAFNLRVEGALTQKQLDPIADKVEQLLRAQK